MFTKGINLIAIMTSVLVAFPYRNYENKDVPELSSLTVYLLNSPNNRIESSHFRGVLRCVLWEVQYFHLVADT
jgi:hypothetical protein